MPRGGHREKAGRPSTWKSGCKFSETKLIRVPAVISDQVLEFAHKLDSGETLDLVTETNSVSLEQIKAASEMVLSDVKLTRGSRDRGRVRQTLQALMKELFSEVIEIETKSKTKQIRLEV
jgi:hypothetical protein